MSAVHRFAQHAFEAVPIDFLTGLPTRDAGMARLERKIELVRSSRTRELALAVLLVDELDVTKDGDDARPEDAVLGAATALRRIARRHHDVVFRHREDELVCAFPFLDLKPATALLQEAWLAFNEEHLWSFSAGFAELRDGDDATALVDRAADCLYAGRKRPDRGRWTVAR